MAMTYIGLDPADATKLVIRIMNTKVKYPFVGDTLAEQSATLRLFAQSMANGRAELTANLMKFVEVDAENFPEGAAGVIELLFGNTDMLFVSRVAGVIDVTRTIYTAEEGLLDDLMAAGAALLEVFV